MCDACKVAMKNIFFTVSCDQKLEGHRPPLLSVMLLESGSQGLGDDGLWAPRSEGSGDCRVRSPCLGREGDPAATSREELTHPDVLC